MDETELVERLGGAELNDHVRVTLTDGTTFEGPASPIDFVPEESLRIELRPSGGTSERYELSAEYDGGWSDVQVRRADAAAEDAGWEALDEVERVEVQNDEDQWEWGPE